MRTPGLTPTKIKGRPKPWMLNIPPSLSETGKRQQHFFENEQQAKAFALQISAQKRTHGELLTVLNSHQLSEAVRAFELLAPVQIGLLDAVQRFLADHKRRSASKTFGEVFESFQAKPGRGRDYMDSLRHTRDLASSLLDRPIIDITVDDLESALAGLTPSVRNLRINRLRSAFRFAVRKGVLESSPADRLDTIKIRSQVRVYSVEDVRRLLRTALATDAEFVPYLSILAFAGLRPEGEATNLSWSDIHTHDATPEIIVQPDTGKMREKRPVPIPPNLLEWLEAHPGSKHAKVMPWSPSTLARRRSALCKAAGVQWIADGFRHTFASAHLATHKSVDQLLLAMGHKDPKMLWRHYYRRMTESDAAAYWSIRPAA